MPSNNTGPVVRDLFEKYPDKIALLQNPTRLGAPAFSYRYAMDNGAFKQFNETQYFKMIDFSKNFEIPMFLVVPDVVSCHIRTSILWSYYYPKLREVCPDYPLAFVAQDGCEPHFIPDEADWIFIGGNDPWKMDNIHKFIGINNKPVHVGRVNSLGRLKYCERLGVKSVDGTGWMRARDKKFYDLLEWFSGEEKQLCLF